MDRYERDIYKLYIDYNHLIKKLSIYEILFIYE